ncbi:MAG: hypothetical protein WA532_13190 [Candidatus Korobacteraceae bacterium]
MRGILIPAVLLLAAPLLAQSYTYSDNAYTPGNVTTPKIHLGSDIQPSVIDVAPVIVDETPVPSSSIPRVSNATPASVELLSTRHFDYIISPLEKIVPGSMEDISISLGDYARQLRAERQSKPSPNAMAQPSEAK